MTTYVVGHGALTADRPMTTVPEGGSITFYSDVDTTLITPNGMEALRRGDAGSGYTKTGGQPVENYYLEAHTDNELVRYQTVAMAGLTVMYVGDQLPVQAGGRIHLCEGDEFMCGEGRHICGGVFGRVSDLDIVYLACRGVAGAPSNVQRAYGATGNTKIIDDLDLIAAEFETMSEEEAGQKLCEMEDEARKNPDLQEHLARLMNWPGMRKAVYKERTRQALETMDVGKGGETARIRAVAAMFYGQPEQEQAWMSEIPAVLEALKKSKKPSAFVNPKMPKMDTIVESPQEDSIVESPQEDAPSEKPKKPSPFGKPK
jgi:hypothetical protein